MQRRQRGKQQLYKLTAQIHLHFAHDNNNNNNNAQQQAE